MTKIEFNEARHTYRVDDKPVPSVTTVLKKVVDKSGPLTWWAQRTALEALCEIHGKDVTHFEEQLEQGHRRVSMGTVVIEDEKP